jgi:hypothetical protein
LKALPQVTVATNGEEYALIEAERLFGLGISLSMRICSRRCG